ncbi:exopolysaccharide biosynthesis polyprenyl glycosylphosphotransferase [Ancylobacter pratisalsi]|uniref:Exopolysaccharide biosynthesis polyprenyl glycosylphosphotransferase n=1 Tax=Ancylobacter pratisalsi TaxID=1745854 RepID=A0A6P1YPX2_9HYPH|nr:exopolysaccharide biosynthesis polyprenyl glycosylphosphotransferase [Ancylobacter pratisalsi]QIB35439.1 exopolysaccharide biosynthesis polyprenyl glycosylphosphotransferase [Ancylobacter pratisalsi]
MTRWTHGLVNRLVRLCDLAMILAAAAAFYFYCPRFSWSQILVLAVLGAATFLSTLTAGHAYRVEHYAKWTRAIRHLVIGSIPAMLAVLIACYALVQTRDDDIYLLAVWAGFTLLALAFGRFVLVRAGMKWIMRNDLLRRDAVVIGDLGRAYELIRSYSITKENLNLLDFVAVFQDGEQEEYAPQDSAPPMLGGLKELLEYAKKSPVDVVVITKPWKDPAAIEQLATEMRRVAADVIITLEPKVFYPYYARMTAVADHAALQVQQRPLKGSLAILKAAEDYVVATAGLIILSPILLLAAIAVKLDSPGPVLFRQARVGLNNRPFMVYKLRTMRFDPTDDGSVGAVKQDPRVTRVGAVLRSLSFDEIPQLLNVLKGDMSVVGPRPHVPNMLITENLRYEAVSDYVARYRMKPGVTGWAQINGMRGGIYTVEKAERGVELDLYYIEHWSIWFDIRILLLTVTRGLSDNSAF